MSTDMQRYSIENQAAAIALYAARYGLDVVRTYTDAGKSGLTLKDRAGLQQLLQDVRSQRPGFELILVYDVSRWGRFQDADESAYYEFLCREAGISVRYCAEQFENDSSLSATVLKAIKRAMAAEYSRELSNRTYAAKCNMAMRGFHTGGRPGYGLRRMLLDERGARRMLLSDGQWKFVHTDRTVLVPGPREETKWVRWIFERYAIENRSIADIVADLNARSVPSVLGGPWLKNHVRTVLSNERYIGNNVFNRTSVRLKSKRIHIHREQWLRAKGVIEPIVHESLFSAAQQKLSRNLTRLTRFALLDHLTAIWCVHGKLSASILESTPSCPCKNTYARIFGGTLEAFRAVGYRHRSRRPAYHSVEQTIARTIISTLEGMGIVAEITRRGRQTRLLVNQELVISISLAHRHYTTLNGRPRWILAQSAPHRSDIAVIATFDEERQSVRDFYLIPGFLLTNPQQIFFDRNPILFEAFRSDTVAPLARALRPDVIGVATPPTIGVAPRSPIVRCEGLHFRTEKRSAGSKRALRAFERCSRRVGSFVEVCTSFTNIQRKLDRALTLLFADPEFRLLLESEGFQTIPTLVREQACATGVSASNPQNAPLKIDFPHRQRALDRATRRLQPERVRQIGEMMIAFADNSVFFLNLLVVASHKKEFKTKQPRSRFMRPKELAQIKSDFRTLEDAARSMLPSFGEQAYRFAISRAFNRAFLNNAHVARYMLAIHPAIHRRLRSICS